MQMVPVRSRVLVAVGYSPLAHELRVQFRGWRIYAYQGVPERIYEELLAAPSKGRYYNRVIRGHYVAVRLS